MGTQVTRQTIYEWMLEHASAFTWSEDGETGLAEDDFIAEAMRLFAHKVKPEHYQQWNKDPKNPDDVYDFFDEIMVRVEDSYE